MAEIGSVDIPVRGVARVPLTAELVEDIEGAQRIQNTALVLIGAEMRELVLDIEFGPRHGPPAPRIEVEEERCESCGRPLDDWDW